MTEEVKTDLIGLAEIALKMCKTDMKDHASPRVIVVCRRQDGSTLQLPTPPNLDMNNGVMKDVLFALLRVATDRIGYNAVLVATEMWFGKPTQKFLDLPEEEASKLSAQYNIYGLEERGLVTKHECIGVTVQTAADVLVVRQEICPRRGRYGCVVDGGPYS